MHRNAQQGKEREKESEERAEKTKRTFSMAELNTFSNMKIRGYSAEFEISLQKYVCTCYLKWYQNKRITLVYRFVEVHPTEIAASYLTLSNSLL